MRILCTHNGRFGDILWACPALRALSRRTSTRIDLLTPLEFQSIHDLLAQQPYLGKVTALDGWGAVDRVPLLDDREGYWSSTYDLILHLGYDGWPQRPLPSATLDCLNMQYAVITHAGEYASVPVPIGDWELHLDRPWITLDGPGPPIDLAVGFTEAWFELKLGLMVCLERSLFTSGPPAVLLTHPGTRWTTELPGGTLAVSATDWLGSARGIRNADLFFGDCSALHVLAVATGTPVVLMEPMEARWNPIFYPLGMDGPQVTVVKGNDDKPTFDARHCRETLERVLSHRKATTS